MYSFEGDFRRKPQQNLGGASSQQKPDRNAFVLQLQQQRQKREERKKQLLSAIKIQACIRSYLTRKCYKQHEREEFDNIFTNINSDDIQLLSKLTAKLLFFFDETKDLNRLVSLSQLLLRHWKNVLKHPGSSVQIRRLLSLHLRLLRANSELSPAVPLRMFEVFTSTNTTDLPNDCKNVIGNTLMYLVCRGYFQDLCTLLSHKAPPLYGPSPNPPTPLCAALFDLIQRPLNWVNQLDIHNYDEVIMTEFASSFLCHPYPEPVEMFVIPALAQDKRHRFPFLTLVKVLLDETNYRNEKLINDFWLLHAVLSLEPRGLASDIISIDNTKLPNNPISLQYLKLLAKLTVNVCNKQITYEYEDSLYGQETTADKDDDSDSEVEISPTTVREQDLLGKAIEYLNDPDRFLMTTCAQINETPLGDGFLDAMSQICHNLLLSNKMALHKYRLLYTLSFKPVFVRAAWVFACAGGGLASVARGAAAALPPLATFCALYNLLIGTLHDTDFYANDDEHNVQSAEGGAQALSLSEVGGVCRALRVVCAALLELAVPDARAPPAPPRAAWTHLFKVVTSLLRALYVRDARLQFFGPDAWPLAAPPALVPPQRARNQEEGPPLTAKEIRTETILKEIPFLIPFSTRVQMFQSLLTKEKAEHWYEMANFYEGPSINISVRRTHLYEDAFEKLSPDNEPDMKLKLRVRLINQAGADEAGVDGGGLFREFLSELLKSAFDPNRGLFRLTKDNMLYPNPVVNKLYDDFQMHYYFVGRMLGKAIYENLLVEVPLAEFFLGVSCGGREADVHALASLDPALYRGLMLLRAHRAADVPDLGLDFTLLTDDLGERKIEELKPGGANIPVTAENRIEYIHLVADFKLNRQIRSQCIAFRRGLTSVVKAEWLRMFSCRELQLLISGAEVPIDINDLREHTQYSGGFSETHPTIQCFWRVIHGFNDDQKRQLLKFVTSCSRPPLLGFKDLQPSFCIQSAGASDRLPSSSTCMNLLKLPEFSSEEILTEKLLYAIQSGAGFELS